MMVISGLKYGKRKLLYLPDTHNSYWSGPDWQRQNHYMRFYFLHFLFLILLSSTYSAQQPGYKEYFMEGSYLLLEDEPVQALKNFEMAYKLDSSNANIHYMIGVCYMTIPSKRALAERFLAKAVR